MHPYIHAQTTPDKPAYKSPGNGATVSGTTATLTWYGGPWAHNYDIYFGTSPSPPLLAANKNLGPSGSSSSYQTYVTPALQRLRSRSRPRQS